MLRVHTYVPAGFCHFPHESARNSCLDSSARNLAENHSGIVRKIRARPRGYPRPSAPENRGIPRKNVSYPCQVPYIWLLTLIESTTSDPLETVLPSSAMTSSSQQYPTKTLASPQTLSEHPLAKSKSTCLVCSCDSFVNTLNLSVDIFGF